MQTNWVCRSEALRFCKNDSDSSLESLIVTGVESFCEKRDSTRVTIFLNVTRVESESPKIVTRVESLTRVTLSLPHIPVVLNLFSTTPPLSNFLLVHAP